jgi:hypothetical protein
MKSEEKMIAEAAPGGSDDAAGASRVFLAKARGEFER